MVASSCLRPLGQTQARVGKQNLAFLSGSRLNPPEHGLDFAVRAEGAVTWTAARVKTPRQASSWRTMA